MALHCTVSYTSSRRRRRALPWSVAALLATLLLVTVFPVFAQSGWTPGDMTEIRGFLQFVTPSGESLARPLLITVTRLSTSERTTYRTMSDDGTGEFVVPSVYPETYTVCVQGDPAPAGDLLAGCRSVCSCQDVTVSAKPAITEITVPFVEPLIRMPAVYNAQVNP